MSAVCALALTGCANQSLGSTYEVDIDPRLTVEQQAVVVAALADWEGHVPDLHLHPRVTECLGVHDGEICTHAVPTVSQWEAFGHLSNQLGTTETDHGSNTQVSGGWGGIDGGEVWLNMSLIQLWTDRGYAQALFDTAQHEVGHAMGLQHHPGAVLMNASTFESIACDDVAQWYELRGFQPPCAHKSDQ